MTWKKKAATAASALLFSVGGMLVTAPPAAADGPCPAKRLCIYDEPNFKGNRILSGSTNACFKMNEFLAFYELKSYDNNLPVDAIVWDYFGGYYKVRTLVAGGFSSNIGVDDLVGFFYEVCMGNARPSS